MTKDGHPLSPPIQLPANHSQLLINADGTIEALMADDSRQTVGTLQLAHVLNPDLLEGTGDNLYRLADFQANVRVGTPGEGIFGDLQGGYLEGSNVAGGRGDDRHDHRPAGVRGELAGHSDRGPDDGRDQSASVVMMCLLAALAIGAPAAEAETPGMAVILAASHAHRDEFRRLRIRRESFRRLPPPQDGMIYRAIALAGRSAEASGRSRGANGCVGWPVARC